MAITPAPGWQIDPNNPNGVVKIGSVNPQTNIAYGNAPTATPQGTVVQSPTGSPTNATVVHTSSQIAPLTNSTPSPYYAPPPPPNNPSGGNGLVLLTPGMPGYVDPNASSGSAGSSGTGTSGDSSGGTKGLVTPSVPTFPQSVGNQATTAQTNPLNDPNNPLVKNLADWQAKYNALQNKIQQFNGAAGTSSDVAATVTGREAVFAQSLAGQLDAAAQQVNAAQTALGQAVSAYSAQTGAQNAVSSQLKPTASFPFVFNPATGTFTSNGTAGGFTGNVGLTGNYQSDISSAAQAVMANPALYSSYKSALNAYYGDTAGAQFDAGIAQAGGNPTNFAAQSSASASNVGTAGTAATNSWQGIYATNNTNQTNYATAQNSINNLGSDVLATMANSPGINPSDSRFLNAKLNDLSTQFNSPAYANFNSKIAGLQRMVSQYLSAGEIPTSATAGAQALIDGSLTVGALAATLQGIDSDLNAAKQSAKSSADYAYSQMQAGNTTPTNNGTNTSTNTGGSGNFSDSAFYSPVTTTPQTTPTTQTPAPKTSTGIGSNFKIDANGNLVAK